MARGRSLHIGLNRIDPAHYGTEGKLAGCHADARDMEAMAATLDYDPRPKLLDDQATVSAVKAAINAASADLVAGDIFLMTYAGHGGQVPDANGDEASDALGGYIGDAKDETWCLFDRMLVDDELYALLGGFREGVRIIVISDSCHSGTVTRDLGATGRWLGRDNLDRVYKEHQVQYDEVQSSYPARDRVIIGASAILISGCQDNQTSADGDGNGLFTEKLKGEWANGAFRGPLMKLRDQIVQNMPPNQTPNYYLVGQPNRVFEKAQAFAI
ncbi:MAG: caspase family protein [Actinomycetota bacterium]|nr:caspase family protein [Actinomycetota bacterium]